MPTPTRRTTNDGDDAMEDVANSPSREVNLERKSPSGLMGSAMKLFKSLGRKDGDGKRARAEASPEIEDGELKRARRGIDEASTSTGSGQSTPPGSHIKPMNDAAASFITSSVRKTQSTVRKTGTGVSDAERVPPVNLSKTFGALEEESTDDEHDDGSARDVLASPSAKTKRTGSRKILDTIFSPVFSFFSSGGTQKTSKTLKRKSKKETSEKTTTTVDEEVDDISVDEPIPSMHESIARLMDIEGKHVELLGGELMSAREYLERFGMTEEEAASVPYDDYDEEYDPWAFIYNLKYTDPRSIQRTKRGPVLPRRALDEFPNTLVLDLDETLVHSNLENTELPFDFAFPVLFNGEKHEVRVSKRPHLEAFMDFVSERFEIVVFTASQRVYADKLLDVLDPEQKWFKHRVFRDSCVQIEGNFMKDLTVLGRDLSKTVIIDNSPQAFGLQIDNGIPIESWYDDPADNHLLSLLPILDEICRADDVRDLLKRTFNLQERVRRGGLRSSAFRRSTREMIARF